VDAYAVRPDQVPALLQRELDRLVSPAQFQHEQALLQALGLLPPQVDLRKAVLRLQSGALAGFYTPVADRLYIVLDTAGSVLTRDGPLAEVLVHELAHALQAQHSHLLEVGLGIESDQDLAFALGALLEGDAVLTELRDAQRSFHEPIPDAAGFRLLFREELDLPDLEAAPRWVRETLLGQYPSGYALVTQLVRRGGMPALDAAWSDPPLSSEELLHPRRYLDRSLRRPLRDLRADAARFAPDGGCGVVAQGSYGELGLRVWAAERGASGERAAAAADGWDGDRAWLLRCPGGPALAWVIHFDTLAEAREFARLAGGLAAEGEGGKVRRVDRSGVRVLLSSGLRAAGRTWLLEAHAGRLYTDLSTWLESHPEVRERARSLRGR